MVEEHPDFADCLADSSSLMVWFGQEEEAGSKNVLAAELGAADGQEDCC